MSKGKISQPKREIDYISRLEEKLKDSTLIFVPESEIEKYQIEIEHAGYQPSVVEVFGDRIGVVMKQELRGALLDPSADDLETLASAGDSYSNYAKAKYGEKARIPSETSLGRLIEDQKIHSLIGNIYEFPDNKINTKAMEKYGLNKQEVLELANRAFRIYCETNGSLDIGGGLSCVESVGGKSFKSYSGSDESVDISLDVCHAESHYKLNLKTNKIQKEVQKSLPVLSEEYTSIEKQAIEIMIKHAPGLTEQIATNLFRMLINLGGAYDLGKALPIK